MIAHTLRLVYLVLTILIASQGMFYLLGIHNALSAISMSAFAEQRKAIDLVIATPLKLLYLSAIIFGVLLLVFFRKKCSSVEYVSVMVAFGFISLDLFFALKENVPINSKFHYYTAEDSLTDWVTLRQEWLKFICIRGVLAICAMLSLLTGWIYPRFLF